MRSLYVAILATALVPLAACNLYFSDNDDDPRCDDWGGGGMGGGLAEPALLLRNPVTGACEAFGNSGPTPLPPCDGDECGPCAGSGSGGGGSTDPDTTPSGPNQESDERVPNPDWGFCESYCNGLDETTCLDTESCRGIYGAGIDSTEFLACWSTGTVPILIEDCNGLDAYSCSQSDQCIAIHESSCDDGSEQDPSGGLVPPTCTPGYFLSCANEATEVSECSELSSEAACIARPDCNAYYVGENCECDTDPNSCVCSTWTYDSCDALPAP